MRSQDELFSVHSSPSATGFALDHTGANIKASKNLLSLSPVLFFFSLFTIAASLVWDNSL